MVPAKPGQSSRALSCAPGMGYRLGGGIPFVRWSQQAKRTAARRTARPREGRRGAKLRADEQRRRRFSRAAKIDALTRGGLADARKGDARCHANGSEKSAEAIVVARAEGPND